MKVRSVQVDLEAFGAELAGLGSDEQALFFKGLARELALWPAQYNAQMQFAMVSDALAEKDRDVLENALGMLWFREGK